MGARDGGDAFPSPGVVLPNQGGVPMQQGAYAGMSLRDYLAGQALIGLLSPQAMSAAFELKADGEASEDFIARAAYCQADAMLKARDA